ERGAEPRAARGPRTAGRAALRLPKRGASEGRAARSGHAGGGEGLLDRRAAQVRARPRRARRFRGFPAGNDFRESKTETCGPGGALRRHPRGTHAHGAARDDGRRAPGSGVRTGRHRGRRRQVRGDAEGSRAPHAALRCGGGARIAARFAHRAHSRRHARRAGTRCGSARGGRGRRWPADTRCEGPHRVDGSEPGHHRRRRRRRRDRGCAGRARRCMKKVIRIGAGSAWWGDRIEPAALNAEKGRLDYLCFETMAEATISAAQVRARRDPTFPGYDTYLDERMKAVLPACMRHGTRIVSNQGWINPDGAAKRIGYWLRTLGHRGVKVASVNGGLITDRVLELTETIMETGAPTATLAPSLISAEV